MTVHDILKTVTAVFSNAHRYFQGPGVYTTPLCGAQSPMSSHVPEQLAARGLEVLTQSFSTQDKPGEWNGGWSGDALEALTGHTASLLYGKRDGVTVEAAETFTTSAACESPPVDT